MTSMETTAPLGRTAYLADAGRQIDQLGWLLASENGQRQYTTVHRDPDVLEQLVDGGYVSWAVQGYYLTDRGRNTALKLAALDAHAEHDRRELAAVEQTGILPAEGTLDESPVEATLPGRHRVVARRRRRRTPGGLLVAYLAVLAAVDRLLTRVAFRIARFVTAHARGLAWVVLATPAVAAGLVLGTTGVFWLVQR